MTLHDIGFEMHAVPCSAEPEQDGYVMQCGGMPFHVHPDATPNEWEMLMEGIAAGIVGIGTYQQPQETQPTVKEQIAILEAEITQRRLREAVLGIDDGWLEQQDAKISALRKKL